VAQPLPGAGDLRHRPDPGGGDVWTVELTVRYDGGEPQYGVDILEISDGRIARETIYVAAPFDAPDWRAPWRAAP
jgi:hypothetical protein